MVWRESSAEEEEAWATTDPTALTEVVGGPVPGQSLGARDGSCGDDICSVLVENELALRVGIEAVNLLASRDISVR